VTTKEENAVALASRLENHRLRAADLEHELWHRAADSVRYGLPLSTALRILGCSRTTFYHKTAEWRQK